MKNGLVRRLVAIYLLIISVLFLYINIVCTKWVEEQVTEQEEQELYVGTVLLMNGYVERYYENKSTITKVMESVSPMAEQMNARVWITTAAGKVVGDTAPLNNEIIYFENLEEDFEEFLSGTFHRNVFYQGVTEKPVHLVVIPFSYEYRLRGYVCSMITVESVMERVNEYVMYLNWVYLFLCLLILAVFIGIYAFMVVPLKKTIAAAKAYSLGNFEKKITTHTGGEYKELADVINYMGDTMYRFNEYQREIIANISHDFRSPLTSIKGYAEAIKDGTIPPEMQEKYLDVVLFEVERLTKLTSNLLTLNTFDQQGMILQPTEFDINDTVKNLALSFEGICKKKRLVIQLVFSAKQIFVQGDREKIERVIYNLVDNAIKFSHADAKISISVEEKGRKAIVSVKDEGTGIPKEDLTKIWDRFYKSDNSRGKDKKGTGLGLSIVREIITAHKENINVISTEGVGTEFVFTLPLVITEEN
ncbi:MAG: HAMP domain-containing histidine kinase [Lachnospiraceae bacterium]|nr:HAMP domain-containing histidine kinase [Lachnospiraceae bacterium]